MSFKDWTVDQVMQHNLRVERQNKSIAEADEELFHGEPKAVAAERDLHIEFIEWLRAREIFFIHSRMDRPSTIGVGDPDFVLLHGGKGCAVEFKRPGKKVTAQQAGRIAMLQRHGTPARVCFDVASAVRFTQAHACNQMNRRAYKPTSAGIRPTWRADMSRTHPPVRNLFQDRPPRVRQRSEGFP